VCPSVTVTGTQPIPLRFRSTHTHIHTHIITLLADHQTAKLDKKLERLSVVSEEKKAQRKKKRKDLERDVESESHAQNDETSEDQQQQPSKVSLKALSHLLPPWPVVSVHI
jgi:hypothetical protein